MAVTFFEGFHPVVSVPAWWRGACPDSKDEHLSAAVIGTAFRRSEMYP